MYPRSCAAWKFGTKSYFSYEKMATKRACLLSRLLSTNCWYLHYTDYTLCRVISRTTSEQCSCCCRGVLQLLLLENAMFGGKIHSSTSMRYGCKMYCILTYYCLLLATVTLSKVTYKTVHSTECGQSGPLQDEQLMVALKQVHEQLGPPGCNPPTCRTDLVMRFTTVFHQLPPAITR